MGTEDRLPLRWTTPADWPVRALADPVALLCDHAHLERKAATNAMDLLGRWPRPVDLHRGCAIDDAGSRRWIHVLTSIAQDELRHLGQVIRLLEARGGHFTRHHQGPYARGLRASVRVGKGPDELVDRLLVAALIEARSCERFELLAASSTHPDLASFYASLCRSERGHYKAFLELAASLPGHAAAIPSAWDRWLDIEARVAAEMPAGSWIHSGVRDHQASEVSSGSAPAPTASRDA